MNPAKSPTVRIARHLSIKSILNSCSISAQRSNVGVNAGPVTLPAIGSCGQLHERLCMNIGFIGTGIISRQIATLRLTQEALGVLQCGICESRHSASDDHAGYSVKVGKVVLWMDL